MNREDYRKAFDELSFSADFQERTADLLQQRARELEKERNSMTFNKTKKMAVLIAACVALLAVSVSAAVMWLTPAQVTQEQGQPLLAEAFSGPDAISINETVESGDFSITLLGLVSGRNLDTLNPDLEADHTYSVLALRRLDGKPLENETFDFGSYTMTPLVAGTSPAAVNNWTLDAGVTGMDKDGVYYYLLDTASIEMFADRTVYMAFYEGSAPNNTIFTVADDGTISFAEDFTGVQALFTLPLDPAKADRVAADAFLTENSMGWTNERSDPEDEWDIERRETADGEEVTIRPKDTRNAWLEPWDDEKDGGGFRVATPEERAAGRLYTAEEFETNLAQRRESFQEMVSTGNMTQADYDEWNQRQEDILAGLRSGTLEGRIVDDVIYFDPIANE